MRAVTWVDKDGWKRRSLVRDGDPDDAAQGGIPQGPPDFLLVDWESVARDLNNFYVEQGVVSWSDLQKSRSLQAGIMFAMKRRVVHAFREREVSDE